jgi:hypothetical protein
MSFNLIKSGLPILDDGTGAGVKLANAKWFTTNIIDTTIPSGMTRKQIIHFAINTNSVVQYTLDDTNWVNFNNGNAIDSNNGFVFTYFARNGDTINIRATQALTVIFARVDVEI